MGSSLPKSVRNSDMSKKSTSPSPVRSAKHSGQDTATEYAELAAPMAVRLPSIETEDPK